jgi:hypothetical protein
VTVAELIIALQKLPQNAITLVWNDGEWEPVGLVVLNTLGKVQIDVPYDKEVAP